MSFLDSGGFGLTNPGALGGAFNDLFGGIMGDQGDQIKSEGYQEEAANYAQAAVLAGQNAQFTVQSTAVQQFQAHRSLELSQGSTEAELGAAGVTSGGSSEDIMRSGAQQGAIQKQLVGQQGLITEAGYTEQQNADNAMAQYASEAAQQENKLGGMSLLGGIVGGIFSVGAAFGL